MIRHFHRLSAAALLMLLPGIYAAAQQPASQAPIRIWGHGALGHDYIESLVQKWETGFRKTHPEVQFDNQLHGTASAIGALYTGTGEIAIMGREIWPVEVEAFSDIRGYPPLGIDVVTGSLDIRNKDFALVVFVNRKNPLGQLSLPQIARLFGAEEKPPTTWANSDLEGNGLCGRFTFTVLKFIAVSATTWSSGSSMGARSGTLPSSNSET